MSDSPPDQQRPESEMAGPLFFIGCLGTVFSVAAVFFGVLGMFSSPTIAMFLLALAMVVFAGTVAIVVRVGSR